MAHVCNVLSSVRVTMRLFAAYAYKRAFSARQWACPPHVTGTWAPLKRALGSWRSFILVRLFRGRHWWPYTARRKVKKNRTTERAENRCLTMYHSETVFVSLAGARTITPCKLCVTVTMSFARQLQPLPDRSTLPGQENNPWNECSELVT